MNRLELRRAGVTAVAIATIVAGCGGAGATRTATRVLPAVSGKRGNPTASLAGGARARGAKPRGDRVTARGSRSAAAPPGRQRSPALRHLQAVLVGALRSAGPRTGALVYDLSDGRTLFAARANVARPPASVEKLYTSVALLRLLGPDARLHTDVLGTGHLKAGVWHGNLYLRGDGDPTFGDGAFVQTWYGGRGARVGSLVAQLRRAGIRRVTGHVYGDGSRFDSWPGGPATHGRPDLPDYGGELSGLVFDHGATARGWSPPAYAARQLVRTMRSEHIEARAARSRRRTPATARELASVASPPLLTMLRLMDVPSDDLFADLFAKQLGYRFLGRGTLRAGATEIGRVLADYGLHPTLHDGSGLDHADRTTPSQVVSLLRQIWGTPVGRMLKGALPVVGESGTVQTIAVHTAAMGHCVAKTGTLNNVTNLAGVCSARHGQQLAFALFIDGPANWQAVPVLGRMVAAIAGY